ncbi:MAG: FliI/YscN family ATPase [Planctomycetes bacterium]|nr:FliI/YscN family ATPase [Planctomycetota bacterium]
MSDSLHDLLPLVMPTELVGRVVSTDGLATSVASFPAPVGALVEIERQTGEPLQGEVIGFRDDTTIIYPFGSVSGVRRGNRVRMVRTVRFLRVGEALLGRVINAHGRPIDHHSEPALIHRARLNRRPPLAVDRPRITTPLATGVRALDAMLTCGRGQRMGIFSGSGVGKSVTLGMMARYTSADVNVIALIGERGREVNEFLQRDLGPEGLARSVVVVATSDEPALVRVQAALAATTVAEFFRDRGQHVLLMMDSITRFAMAQREIGLAAGEPPTTRGYPPSVFALLPRLVERAGLTARGSITAFYSVLVEGDDTNEPVSDAVRGLLDGHTVLSRRMAGRGHYPAVDLLESISRLMPDLVTPEQREAARAVRELIAVYREHEDLITIGAYPAGSNPLVDAAIAMKPEIDRFLRQDMNESSDFETTVQALRQLAHRCRQPARPAASRHATHETKEHRPA